MIRTVGAAVVLGLASLPASAESSTACREPKIGSKNTPMFSPPLAKTVTGRGRLQFYSAPNRGCAIAGMFVVPRDDLTAYAETDDGWLSVMYTNPGTGGVAQGWVRSTRLKTTGTDGPAQ